LSIQSTPRRYKVFATRGQRRVVVLDHALNGCRRLTVDIASAVLIDPRAYTSQRNARIGEVGLLIAPERGLQLDSSGGV